MKKIKEKIVILYDGGDCSDGFGGAWVAEKKFGKKARYIGVHHQHPIPDGLENKIIYMIDFTYPENIVGKLIKENISVTSIDHHVSALKAVKMTQNYSYSENHSGSVLAWNYFFPEKPLPVLLKYIEDMDLWRNKLPYSKEIFAYHQIFGFDFRRWNKLEKILEGARNFRKCAEIGRAILKYEENLIELIIKSNAEKVLFNGVKARAVNSPFFSSQMGNKLLGREIPVGIVWRRKRDEINVSLRGDGRIDVSELAARYGGGGHENAAGFTIKKGNKLPWKTIK